jgi:glutathione S-transferase
VQRAVIALRAKSVEFETTYVNLREKPDWFLEMSPHGKVPVLQVGDEILFESNAIAEYLDETVEPKMHPADPITRARHRAWTDFVPDFSSGLSGVYYAKTKEASEAAMPMAHKRLERISYALENHAEPGPYFGGDKLCLVDCAYTPFFQRFLMADELLNTKLLDQYPTVNAWAEALMAHPAVDGSVADVFPAEFDANMRRRGTYAATLMQQAAE